MRLHQILRGWSNYFKHAVAKARFTSLQHFVWQRVIRMRSATWIAAGAPRLGR
ncbi:group II intron maturase-specific domain-containing protein [Nocardia sp. NPDC004278]